jgi:predicted membrane-bound mannosyltransferase
MLIPLYEQLAVVFGLIGLVYSLFRPTRFRMFLAWWFAGSLGLYSWAGEKMPWLSIHITLPLMLLAAVALTLDRSLAGRVYRPARPIGIAVGFGSCLDRPLLAQLRRSE